MKENTLLKISLISSIVGILVLLFISSFVSTGEKSISNISKEDLGSSVRINGIITEVRQLRGATSINVAQLQEINVIVFDNVTLYKGDYVEITGKIDDYEGNQELIADKIVLK